MRGPDNDMITTAYGRTLAAYNQWMNSRLYARCGELEPDALYDDRGAFFGSIYLTLNHIVYADLAFLSRFTGEPEHPPDLGVDLYGDFEQLRAQRETLDTRLIEWSAGLDADWLETPLSYVSKVDGRTRCLARWTLVVHLFNHQTHHRGQVTTLLSQMGVDMGSTDIPFMPMFAASTD